VRSCAKVLSVHPAALQILKFSGGYTFEPPLREHTRDGTGYPGHGSPGQRFWPGRVGSRFSVSDPVFDPVFSFNMRVYRGVVSTE